MTANPQQNPVFPPPQQRNPQQIAGVIADYVRAGITIATWVVLGALALGSAYVALRAVLWGVRVATQALGV